MAPPLRVFHWIFTHYLESVTNLLGLTLISPKLVFNNRTRFLVFFLIFCCVCFAYTIATYDKDVALQSASFLPLPIEGLIKFYAAMRHMNAYYTIIQYLQRFYEANNNEKSKISYALVQKWANLFALIVKSFSLLLACMGVLAISSPFVVHALFGDWQPIALVYMPFVDENTFVGFSILYVFHFMTCWLSVIGFICADLVLAVFILHYVPMVLVFEQIVISFNNVITKTEKVSASHEANEYFGNIIQLHKELLSYMNVICSINTIVFFVEINADTLSLVVCLYIINTMTFYPAYLLFVLMFTKLMALCILGTIVDIMNDKLLDVLMNLNWYMLPISMQRDFGHMLLRAQKPETLFAGTVPINLDTFVNCIKSVYSVGMLLAETVV